MSSQQSIAHYRILSKLGEGGMGTVYRATDTKLNREVALKILPDALASDPDYLARFTREAQALAALNHPNIAAIYGIEERAIVMELVPGSTLQERIEAGPVPLEESLHIAAQIADALEAAHEKGIIHRDLKPANVKLTPDGVVKVLDFGLAKTPESSTAAAANSPTLTMRATQAGVIMGTAGYMAPEQAAGRPVDRRADIWSFGVVLYELLTGKTLFTGETISHTLASVLKDPLTFDIPQAPAAIRRLLARCLNRNVKDRLRDIGEARIAIRDYLANPGVETPAPAAVTSTSARRSWFLPAICATLAVALAASVLWHLRPAPAPPVTRFTIPLALEHTGRTFMALSPDGTSIAYVVAGQLYVRSFAEWTPKPLLPSDSGVTLTNPVFSPDGKFIAFMVGNEMKRIPSTGGMPTTICASCSTYGVYWSGDSIFYGSLGGGIGRIPARGGTREVAVPGKANEAFSEPQLLPGGDAVLFTSGDMRGGRGTWAAPKVEVFEMKSGKRKVLVENALKAQYLPTGHLLYWSNGVLMAAPFDLGRLELTGSSVGVVEGVARGTGTAHFICERSGTLAYLPGAIALAGQSVLARVDSKGGVDPLKVPFAEYGFPRASKDGKRVVYEVEEPSETSIWIWDLAGDAAPRRLTLPGKGTNRYPIWSSDGQFVAFQSDREGDLAIWRQRSDGSGAPEHLTTPPKGIAHIPDSWSPDGQTLLFTQETSGKDSQVWSYAFRDRKVELFASAPGESFGRAAFSPDGRWVAYQATVVESRSRIYIRPFPRTEDVYIAPPDNDSHHPVWSPDGKQLFYVTGPSQLHHRTIATGKTVTFGPAQGGASGFSTAIGFAVRTFDALPDGEHFIGVVPAGTKASSQGESQIHIVLNWFEELNQRVPLR